MTLKLGATSIAKAYLGSTEVKKIYLGNSLVYSKTESLWTPNSLGSDLDLWLDAADTSSLSLNSGSISQWSDKSQNSLNAFQSNSLNQPTVAYNAINSKSAILFNGSSQFFNLPIGAARPEAYTSFFVFKTATGGTPQKPIWTEEPAVEIDSKNYVANSDEFGIIYDQFTPTGGFIQTGQGTFTDSILILVAQQTSLNNRSLYINGNLIGSSTEQYTGDSVASVRIGARINSSHYHNSLIAEIVSIPFVSTELTRKKVEGYLAWKWGLVGSLPSDHPYKNLAP